MFFYLSKIIFALTQPSNFIALMTVVGLALLLSGRSLRWGRRILVTSVAAFLVCGYLPVGNWLILPLEQRFPRTELPEKLTGILILGGFEVPDVGHARGQLSLNEAAERITEGLRLAHLRRDARLVFTGGAVSLLVSEQSAAETISRYLQEVGVAPARILLEAQSRTTYENALFLKEMLSPRPDQRWALVTSAFHMPRSVATFRHLGFDVLPWPTDYRTRGWQDIWRGFSSPPDGFQRLDTAFKEWIGLVAYRLSGRSSAFWPAVETEHGAVRPSAAAGPSQAVPR